MVWFRYFVIYVLFLSLWMCARSETLDRGDYAVMQSLAKNIKADETLGWDLSADPCSWKKVVCQNGRVTGLDFQSKGVTGSLPPDFGKLSGLQNLSIQKNKLTGPLPSFSGMSDLRSAYVNDNQFSSIPEGFFKGLTNLQVLALDENIFPPWTIPDDLKDSSSLANFSATNASVTGPIPSFFGDFPNLITLSLAFNNLTGSIPASFGNNTSIRILWLNNQKGNRLSGSLDVISGMQSLTQLWLHFNSFTGPIPDLSGLTSLKDIRLDGNKLTGLVPKSLSDLPMLTNVTLSGNALQGPYPVFAKGVVTDVSRNDFCLDSPGDCDQRVNTLLAFAKDLGYPYAFASDWKGNNPCSSWLYVSCDSKDEISVLNMKNLNLTGTLSPVLANFTHLTQVILSNNNIYGTIPPQLTTLTQLSKLDLSNNNLQGTIPKFKPGVLIVDGNKNIGKNVTPQSPQSPQSPGSPSNPVSPASPASESPGKSDSDNKKGSSSNIGAIVGGVIGGILALGLIGFLCFCLRRRTQKSGRVQSPNVSVADPHHSANSDARQLLKISIDGRQSNSMTNNDSVSSHAGRQSDIHVVEAGNMIISIEVLRNVTNNFSDENVLGRGGFGVVYRGELHDGTKIAVKRMEAGIVTGKGLNEFQAEIAVLTKVRHRHLVALLGYCVEGNERLLVYEYMPQGPLSHHLFEWQKRDLNPMDWTRRLTIALDVARGVEYLHSLAQKSFIHRDLKPSNILLGDDLRAKVSDFGLVRLAPEGKYSVETRLAGTFGYLAPEYAVTGRVTTKADVFSYGVVLMELITGRKALDENEPEESMHLVTWFRRMHVNKENFRTAIDKTLEQTEETYKSICTVAELAGYCTAREPYQRPDMGHAVNVLSSLVEQWKPAKMDEEDMYGIDFDMSLPQALKKWQSLEDSNAGTTFGSSDNTQTSIPTRPSGFAESFTSADGR